MWGLLAFLTEKENGKCLLIYKGTKENPEVYFDLDRGNEYLEKISEIFFDQGHGIFLTTELNEIIFHVRTNVYKIIDKEKHRGNTSGEVLLENRGIIEFFRGSFEKLRSRLKKNILVELRYEIRGDFPMEIE